MSAKDELKKHATELAEATGVAAEIIEEGTRLFVLLQKVPLPLGVASVSATDVLFITDTQYPLSAMDMFWTEIEVMRLDSSLFEGSECVEEYMGRKWRRFSYHRNGIWNPGGNPLLDHYTFVETRWSGKAQR